MNKKWTFRFRTREPIQGEPLTLEEAEAYLLAKLNEPNGDIQEARLELIFFYGNCGREAEAMRYTDEFLAACADPAERAEMCFRQGQLTENLADWQTALLFYSKSLELGTGARILQYFLHNNIGYSLNQIGRYLEAETHLRKAIGIDATRANAFKNLGLSLQYQGRFGEAIRSFIDAVRADASDPRALRHLEELAGVHKEVYLDIPDLDCSIFKCREAVEFAAANQAAVSCPIIPGSKRPS